MSGEERAIFDEAARVTNTASFRDVREASSRAGEEIRTQLASNLRVPNASVRRLGQLKSTIDNVYRRYLEADMVRELSAARTATKERVALDKGRLTGPLLRRDQATGAYRTAELLSAKQSIRSRSGGASGRASLCEGDRKAIHGSVPRCRRREPAQGGDGP